MKVTVEFELDESWDKEYSDCSDDMIFLDLEEGSFTGAASSKLIKIER